MTWDTDFWHAVTTLNLPVAWAVARTSGERRLVDALQSTLEGRPDEADRAVVPLLQDTDTLVRQAARVTYDALLSAQSAWGRLAGFADSAPPLEDPAGVERWAPAFSAARPRTEFGDTVSVLPLTRTPTGVPTVTVYVNGKPERVWIDTGASISILSAAVAEECGVHPVRGDTLELLTAVGRIPARPAVVSEVRMGGLVLGDVPAMIVDTAALTLRVGVRPEGPTAVGTLPIDGIIGFDVIRKIDLTVDDARGRVVVRRPVVRPERGLGPRNLFWFGLPVVTLFSEHGVPVHLSLDTGADETYGTRSLAIKTGTRAVVAERRGVHGFGGSVVERGVLVPQVRLYLGGVPLLFRRVFLYRAQYPTIFELDGTLGADVGRGGVVRIDAANGRFEVGTGGGGD